MPTFEYLVITVPSETVPAPTAMLSAPAEAILNEMTFEGWELDAIEVCPALAGDATRWKEYRFRRRLLPAKKQTSII